MDIYGSAWIVTMCSDLTKLDTVQFYTIHGDWNPIINDIGINPTPIRADLGLYERHHRPDKPLH
jgi:hypothetical protein